MIHISSLQKTKMISRNSELTPTEMEKLDILGEPYFSSEDFEIKEEYCEIAKERVKEYV